MFNEEYRHTSLIATLREQWDLGDPFTARDAAARTFSNVFTLDTPRDPKTWPVPKARPVPPMQQDMAALGAVLSVIGKTMLQGIREYAAEHNLEIDGLPKDPKAAIPDDQVVNVIRGFLANWFPLLASEGSPSIEAAQSEGPGRPGSSARLAERVRSGYVGAGVRARSNEAVEDFQDSSQEWRRLFSELLGTFFLVLVAAGGGMMGQAFPDTISAPPRWSRPGLW